jgi:hypothetical protein
MSAFRIRSLAIAGLVFAGGAAGCAGHESRVETALAALDASQPAVAVQALDEELELDGPDAMPADMRTDDALLVLDRGTVQLSLGDWKRATRDLGAADKAIDILDMSRDAADDLGKYLFSDDVGPYRAPAYEKLMINTFGVAGYLAQGNVDDAKVEARRLAIVGKYLEDNQETTTMLGVGSYLSGFAFEKAGETDEALLFYEEALAEQPYTSLRDPIRVLSKGAPVRARSKELVGAAGPLAPVSETGECDVLVLVAYGRVPRKLPVRLPVGVALSLVAGALSPADEARANELVAEGLVTWVNFPALGPSRGAHSAPIATLRGAPVPLDDGVDLDGEAHRVWEDQKSTLVLSAITRMLTRFAIMEGSRAAGRAAKKGSGEAIGLLAGLAASVAMTAADTPDTRSWSTLPARIAIGRFRVPAGDHTMHVTVRGADRTVTIHAKKGGWAFVPIFELR